MGTLTVEIVSICGAVIVGMNDEKELSARAELYGKRRRIQLDDQLGFGMHGIVFESEHQSEILGISFGIAVKFHTMEIPYFREKETYQRLAELEVEQICGCDVPRALHFDDEFLAMELTIVQPPFILDFGGAWLDEPPEFPPNVIAEWTEQKREQFDSDWPLVEKILRDLRLMGIHLLDLHPANIDLRGHPERPLA